MYKSSYRKIYYITLKCSLKKYERKTRKKNNNRKTLKLVVSWPERPEDSQEQQTLTTATADRP